MLTLILMCRNFLLIYAYLWIDKRFEKYLSWRMNLESIYKMVLSKKKRRVIYISFILDTKLKFPTIKPSRHTPYVYITYTGMHIFCYISIFSYLAYCLRQLTQSLRHLSTLYTLFTTAVSGKNKLSWSFNLFFMISFAIITIQFNSIYCPELYSSSEYKV